MAGKVTFVFIYFSLSGLALSVQTQALVPDNQQTRAAAHPEANPDRQAVSIKVSVNSVVLNASVRDRYSNRSLSGLAMDDFRVYEDGVLQELQQTKTTDAPYSLLLLMDVSGSTYSYLKLMKKAADDFLYEIGENDKVAIASFNSKVKLLLNFTADRDAAAKAITRLHSAGGTAFYDAAITCVDQYMGGVEGRKAIVVFTDGVDNLLSGDPKEGSRNSYDELLRHLQETDALIYTVFLNSRGKEIPPSSGEGVQKTRPILWPMPGPQHAPFSLPWPAPWPTGPPKPVIQHRGKPARDNDEAAYQTAREQLEAIAQLTGGRTYAPRKIDELSGAYSEIADDLRIQYLLSYASSNTAQSPGWHSIRVEIKGHPEAVVRTRSGYAVSSREQGPDN